MQNTVQQLLRELLDHLEAMSLGQRGESDEFEVAVPLAVVENFQAALVEARTIDQSTVITGGFSPRSMLAKLVFRRSGLSMERFSQLDSISDAELEDMVEALEALRPFHQITAAMCE